MIDILHKMLLLKASLAECCDVYLDGGGDGYVLRQVALHRAAVPPAAAHCLLVGKLEKLGKLN